MSLSCYIFDIDGTIANLEHRLHHIQGDPKNWDAFFSECHLDAPIEHMRQLARDLSTGGASIVYVSGRSDSVADETFAWLVRHGFPIGNLLMRRHGDHRPDNIVKSELLDSLIEDAYKPIMAFEDRNQVVQMWRSRGIPCAQVAEGDF